LICSREELVGKAEGLLKAAALAKAMGSEEVCGLGFKDV